MLSKAGFKIWWTDFSFLVLYKNCLNNISCQMYKNCHFWHHVINGRCLIDLIEAIFHKFTYTATAKQVFIVFIWNYIAKAVKNIALDCCRPIIIILIANEMGQFWFSCVKISDMPTFLLFWNCFTQHTVKILHNGPNR